MSDNNQYQDDPMVGIFWYDTVDHDLFGVYSVLAADVNYTYSDGFGANVKTCRPLHYVLWQKLSNKYANTPKGAKFTQDYCSVPRGRIFEVENQGFVVCVERWIIDYPEARNLILAEFQLPDDTEFEINSHWDLGHGWSDKHF